MICAAGINRRSDHPERYRELIVFEPDGGPCIVDPRGEMIAGPVKDEEITVVAAGSLDVARSVTAAVDIAGHCSRPDVFRCEVGA